MVSWCARSWSARPPLMMNTNPALPSEDQIMHVLLRIARRADAAVRASALDRSSDRQVWLRAECEVFELMEPANAAFRGTPAIG